jgi:hypothetical protein
MEPYYQHLLPQLTSIGAYNVTLENIGTPWSTDKGEKGVFGNIPNKYGSKFAITKASGDIFSVRIGDWTVYRTFGEIIAAFSNFLNL